jgi:transcriptional regulator of arginine metabolism
VNRRERHNAILRLIAEHPISTQTELAQALHDAGHDVVQTTVSRDVHELGLVKVRDGSGRLVYAQPGVPDAERQRLLAAAFARWALTCESTGDLVVVRTPAGHANALARAVDESNHPHVLGTIAGDDTIFIAARQGVEGAVLRDELRNHLQEGAAAA